MFGITQERRMNRWLPAVALLCTTASPAPGAEEKGPRWLPLDEAMAAAKESGKPVFLVFR
jgi:hypothetical protein